MGSKERKQPGEQWGGIWHGGRCLIEGTAWSVDHLRSPPTFVRLVELHPIALDLVLPLAVPLTECRFELFTAEPFHVSVIAGDVDRLRELPPTHALDSWGVEWEARVITTCPTVDDYRILRLSELLRGTQWADRRPFDWETALVAADDLAEADDPRAAEVRRLAELTEWSCKDVFEGSLREIDAAVPPGTEVGQIVENVMFAPGRWLVVRVFPDRQEAILRAVDATPRREP